jgi:hypothetical protein
MIIKPEDYIYFRLVSSPAVARIVGFNVYPIAVPKSAGFPFIVYKRQNIIRESSLTGPMFMPLLSIQVASWAMSHDAARELGDEVRLALDGNTGTAAGATIQDMRLVSETDDYLDPTAVGAQLPPAYEVRQLYQIRWQEAAS